MGLGKLDIGKNNMEELRKKREEGRRRRVEMVLEVMFCGLRGLVGRDERGRSKREKRLV